MQPLQTSLNSHTSTSQLIIFALTHFQSNVFSNHSSLINTATRFLHNHLYRLVGLNSHPSLHPTPRSHYLFISSHTNLSNIPLLKVSITSSLLQLLSIPLTFHSSIETCISSRKRLHTRFFRPRSHAPSVGIICRTKILSLNPAGWQKSAKMPNFLR